MAATWLSDVAGIYRKRPGADAISPAQEGPAVRIGNQLWMSKGVSNSYAIGTDDGRVVLNAGLPFEGRIRRRAYDAVCAGPTRKLVFTQGHADHFAGYRGLLDAGMEVIYTGLRRTPEQIVRAAIEEDVDWIGISLLSGAHRVLVPRIRALLNESGAGDIRIMVGGIIPQEDVPELEAVGVARVFLSGTTIAEIVDFLEQSHAGAQNV